MKELIDQTKSPWMGQGSRPRTGYLRANKGRYRLATAVSSSVPSRWRRTPEAGPSRRVVGRGAGTQPLLLPLRQPRLPARPDANAGLGPAPQPAPRRCDRYGVCRDLRAWLGYSR